MDVPLRNRFTTALQEIAFPADRHGLKLVAMSIESINLETKNNISHHLKLTWGRDKYAFRARRVETQI